MTTALELVLLLLAAAVMVVVVFRYLNLPPILGYLLVGAAVGPHALSLLPAHSDASDFAEFGVVFLMFSIGLEFSLPKLYSMKRIVFGLGCGAGGADRVVRHRRSDRSSGSPGAARWRSAR